MTDTCGSTLRRQRFTGERALFGAMNVDIAESVFADGESPLKHATGVQVEDSVFAWKYPLWYARDVRLDRCTLEGAARAGIWYTDGVTVRDSTIEAPKTFRRSSGITLERVSLPHADETLWECSDLDLTDVSATGDYFAKNVSRVRARKLDITGNYAFDCASDVEISDARIISKDAFWNSRDVTVRDSTIVGEYVGWNSRNLTLENCTISSLQALCYVDGLVLRNCRFVDTTLAFEYSTVDAEVTTPIESVINPRGGVIRAPEIGMLILDPARIDPSATRVDAAVRQRHDSSAAFEERRDAE